MESYGILGIVQNLWEFLSYMESLGIIWNFWELYGIFGILENLREFLDFEGI